MPIEKVPKNLKQITANKTGLFYIHIPKTGGQYIKRYAFKGNERVFWKDKHFRKHDWHPCGLSKPLISGIRNHSDSYIKDISFMDERILKFTTVRNPFDMYVSLYCVQTRKFGVTFDDYIKTVCSPDFKFTIPPSEKGKAIKKSDMGPYDSLFILSQKFLFYQMFDDDGLPTADLVLRQEGLVEGLDFLASSLDLKIKHLAKQASPPPPTTERTDSERDYRTFYTDETREIVENYRKRELEAFGYTFDGHDGRIIFEPKHVRYNVYTDLLELLNDDSTMTLGE